MTAFTYDGPLTVVTNTLNQDVECTVNALGQLLQVKGVAGTTVDYKYDAFGNLTHTTTIITALATPISARATRPPAAASTCARRCLRN